MMDVETLMKGSMALNPPRETKPAIDFDDEPDAVEAINPDPIKEIQMKRLGGAPAAEINQLIANLTDEKRTEYDQIVRRAKELREAKKQRAADPDNEMNDDY